MSGPDLTAVSAAFGRAAHVILDEPPYVLPERSPPGLERALPVEIPVRGNEPVCYEVPLFVARAPTVENPLPHGLNERYNRSFPAPKERAMWQRSPTGDSESTTCEVPVG